MSIISALRQSPARGDDDALRTVLDELACTVARDHARHRPGIVHHKPFRSHTEVKLRSRLLGKRRHRIERIHAVRAAFRLTGDGVLAFEQHFLLKVDLQIVCKPVNRLAEMVGAELLHVVIELVTAARQEVLQKGRGIVLDARRLLHGRSRPVEPAERKRA